MNQLAKNANLTISDSRWLQVLAKDATTDGTFYYLVSITGVLLQAIVHLASC